MRKATFFSLLVALVAATPVFAQQVDFQWEPSQSEGFPGLTNVIHQIPYIPAYAPGVHSGARSIAGPVDLDGDGKMEVVLSDYSGGGRVHIIENVGVDTWELIFSAMSLEPTSGTSNNARGIGAGDLDGDGLGEVYIFAGHGLTETTLGVIGLLFPGFAPSLFAIVASGDNEFGLIPKFWDFDGDLPDRFRTEQMTIADVDGDGANELLFGNNGADNRYDSWYVLSADGLDSEFTTWTQEARWSSRAAEDYDPVNRGGGSAYGIVPADLDGDGSMEIVLGSWNNLNFSNVDVTGPDTYADPTGDRPYARAASSDHVSFFGCTVLDMDMNGDDEVYCPVLQTGALALMNYEAGEDPLQIYYTSDVNDDDYSKNNLVNPLVEAAGGGLGITHGDIDKDGVPELILTGSAYSPQQYAAGNPPRWVNIVDYNGGDVEDPANYEVRSVDFPMPAEMIFDTVNRDSAGTMTTYLENGPSPDNPEFAGKIVYLGDVDGDGHNEVAMSFQGVADSIYVYNEVFNPADSTYARTVAEVKPHPHRAFMRVLSGDGISTRISQDRIIVPSDFELHGNYPNPFNPSTTFTFTLPLDKRVSVRVYDMTGRLVRTLVNDEYYAEGTHSVVWNGLSDSGHAVASGQYIYTLEWGQFRQARRMVLVK